MITNPRVVFILDKIFTFNMVSTKYWSNDFFYFLSYTIREIPVLQSGEWRLIECGNKYN